MVLRPGKVGRLFRLELGHRQLARAKQPESGNASELGYR
jgi:hypothetical protein